MSTLRLLSRSTLVGVVVLVLSMMFTNLANAQRPNVVIIIADDVGYGDTSTYGGPISTPNLSHLASRGTTFTDFHVDSLCSPTRASLATGKYPEGIGVTSALTYKSQTGIKKTEVTLAEVLKEEGYLTGLIGKWHLGRQEQFHPLNHGFTFFYGMVGGRSDHLSHRDLAGNLDWWRNKTPLTNIGTKEYAATAVTREAIAFITRAVTKLQPFFLQVAYSEPHTPYQGPGDRVGTDNPTRFPAMVRAVDEGVGKIVRHLETMGIEDNTLVFFMSDNGGHKPASSNFPLRGGKGSVFEGGVRVPAIASLPGRIPAGRVSGDIIAVQDLYPTVLKLVNAPLPPHRIDGYDITDVLFDTGPAPSRLLFSKQNVQKSARDGSWKLVIIENQNMLFNLATDVGERNDVAPQHPDIVARLQLALSTWEATVRP